MMDNMLARGRVIAARRTCDLIEALIDAAEAELPAHLEIERHDDGVAIRGRALTRLLAYDGRLRGLVPGLRR